MRKVLVGIPVLNGHDWIEDCIKSSYSQADDFLIIDNGSNLLAKNIIEPYQKIVNETNIYVNSAWNQIMKYFLESDNDYLIIQNSDLLLREGSIDVIRNVDIDAEKVNILVHLVDKFSENPSDEIFDLGDGMAGVMIVLDKKMCEMVYPIPDDLKLWYGDNWIYCKLQKAGYKFHIYKAIEGMHAVSKSVNYLSESERGPIIDSDKNLWENKYRYEI
jgi:hypothetical protein